MKPYVADPIPKTISAQHLRLVVGELFSDCGVADPMLEADRMLCHVMGVGRAELHAHPERTVGPDNFSRIIELSIRRASGEPLAYLFGGSFFCGREFEVGHGVLIPRPETEILTSYVDKAMKKTGRAGHAKKFADWCTGSGCIAITLLLDNPGWRAYAVDSSEAALSMARKNAARHGVADRLELILCDDPDDARGLIAPGSLDLFVANPPYIPTKEIPTLETQVRDFEPTSALDGGYDGLDVCRLLLEKIPQFMKPSSEMFFETSGPEQIGALKTQKKSSRNATLEKKLPDHRGIERFAVFSI